MEELFTNFDLLYMQSHSPRKAFGAEGQ